MGFFGNVTFLLNMDIQVPPGSAYKNPYILFTRRFGGAAESFKVQNLRHQTVQWWNISLKQPPDRFNIPPSDYTIILKVLI